MSRFLLAGSAAGLFALTAGAAEPLAELSLEQLLQVEVSGASRYAQPLAEAPATATVLTAEDIRRHAFRDLGEALQTVRGVHVTRDRAYSYMGVRGFNRPGDYNSRIVLLVDGARTNNPIYDQAMIGPEAPVDMDWIKRLEFVPGPVSASYGGNALFGIVNAVRWSGADIEGTRIAFDLGADGARRASLLSGGRLEGSGDWLAGVAVYRRAGEDLHFPEYAATAHGRDGERTVKAMLKGSREHWDASFSYAERVKDIPTAYYGTLFDVGGNFNRDREYHLDIGHATALAPQLDQRIRFHLGGYAYDADYPYPGSLYRDEARANWWNVEGQWQWGGWRDHHVLAGIDLRRSWRLSQRTFTVAPRAIDLDDSHAGHSLGLYVQDEWRIAPHWIANFGARVDRQDTARTMISPRAALIWRARDNITVKGLLGRAFRAPNDYERHYADGPVGDPATTQIGNPDLRPERAFNQELSVDYIPVPNLRLNLGYYRQRVRDLIEQQDEAGVLVFRNLPTVRMRGWETGLEALLTDGWRLRASLSWQDMDHPGGAPVNMPRRLGKLLLDGPLPALGATLGLNIQATSARRTLTGRVGGHVTGNLVLRQEGNPRRGLWSLALYNFGDRRYRDPVGPEQAPIDAMEQDGRQWRLRWELGF